MTKITEQMLQKAEDDGYWAGYSAVIEPTICSSRLTISVSADSTPAW